MMRSKVVLAVVVALVSGALPSVARATPTISVVPINTAGVLPFGTASGPDGNIWFTELLNSAVGKVTTDGSNTITEYPTPTTNSQPLEIAAGHDGKMWFTENNAPRGSAGKIGNVTTDGRVTEITVPTVDSSPAGITAGPDGNMWFTESTADKIAKVTTDGSNTITEYPFPFVGATICRGPRSIAAGPDGNLWFTESSNHGCQAGPLAPGQTCHGQPCLLAYSHVGRIIPSTGEITEFAPPTANSLPFVITAGPDNNMWFTEFLGNQVGRILTSSPNTITEFPLPAPSTGGCAGFPTPAGCAFLKGITSGPDGNVWFSESRLNKIGRISPNGSNTITEFPTPAAPQYITAGSDGNLWFPDGNGIGRLVPDAIAHNLAGAAGGNNALFVKPDNADFQGLDGLLLGAPAVVSVPDNTGASTPLYIAVGGDHRLYVRNASAGWQRLVTPEQQCYDNPAAAVTGPSGGPYLLTVVCQGGDNGLYYWQSPVIAGSLPTIGTSFQSLGGKVLAGPAVAPINGVLTFFAEGLDHYIYSRTADPASVFTQIAAPAACIGHPAVSSNGPVAYAACQGLDGQLYYSIKFGTAPWAPFRSGGGQLIDGPGISLTPTRATFNVEGANQRLFHRSIHLNDGTLASPYVDDGGIIQYGVGATALLLAPS